MPWWWRSSALVPATLREPAAMMSVIRGAPTVVFTLRPGGVMARVTTAVVSWLGVMVVVWVVRPLGGAG